MRARASLNAREPTRAPWDGRTLAIGAALCVAQGIGLPLYAWWSGDRDMDRIAAAIAKAIQSAASENEAQRAVQHEKVDGNRDGGAS